MMHQQQLGGRWGRSGKSSSSSTVYYQHPAMSLHAPKSLTLHFLQDLLTKSDPDVVITNFEVSTGSGRGDNYTATLYRVRVHGTRKDGDNEEHWTRSLIYKCLPDNVARRQAYKSDFLFRNEVLFYTQVLPALLHFQEESGIKNPCFGAVPRCYLALDTALVLEDLCDRGLRMADRKAGLDEAHCRATLTELGLLHALSLAMKLRQPEEFASRVIASVKEGLFLPENEDWYRGYYRAATRNALTMVKEALGSTPRGSMYIDKFREFVDDHSFFSRMVSLVKPREPLAVVCHGDCWTNNILFRYSDKGDILEVCFVDFQMARYGSPALDLVNLLYVCTSREMRQQHLPDLLAHYHQTLHFALVQLVGDTDVPQSDLLDFNKLWNMIQEELHHCGRFGLGLALDMIPISTCDSDQAPDLYASAKPLEPAALMNNQPPPCTSSELCRQRMADLVQELVDSGDL